MYVCMYVCMYACMYVHNCVLHQETRVMSHTGMTERAISQSLFHDALVLASGKQNSFVIVTPMSYETLSVLSTEQCPDKSPQRLLKVGTLNINGHCDTLAFIS